MHLPGRVCEAVRALADHAQGADLRAHRRHRGRADHLAARGHRRRAQLGLPVLLAARRHDHPGGAAAHGLHRRGRGLAGVAGARGGRQTPATSRSCTGWRASGGWPSGRPTWLPGYENSAPVRIGNAAVDQRQLDVYGEVIDAITLGKQAGLRFDQHTWAWSGSCWSSWRRTGASRTRASGRCAGRGGTSSTPRSWPGSRSTGPAAWPSWPARARCERWRAVRDQIHAEICEQGYDAERGTFTQYYGSQELDAAVLLILEVGLPAAGRPAGDLHRADHPARAGPGRAGAALHPARRGGQRRRRPTWTA